MSAGLFSLRRGVGVINDQMIKVAVRSDMKAIREEKDTEQALARREKRKSNDDQESKVNYDRVVVLFDEVESLSLSYHNISEIKNLVGLSRLTTLKLDNNTITRIEHLDHLIHLTWLDLSFNNIEQITGLKALTQLTDLSLFNNSIETIEGLDTLVNLEVLSLGNNKMNDLDNLKDLRTFSKLKMLCLDDNPIVHEPEYKMIVLAFLPQLSFLDFTMVDPDEVLAAKEQYQDDLMELEEKERMSSAMLERDRLKAHKTSLLIDACIDPIETLFDSMYMEDNEILKLLVLPGVQLLKDDFCEKLTALADDIKNDGLAIRARQLLEITKLNNAILKVQNDRQQKAIEAIETYESNVNTKTTELNQTVTNEDPEATNKSQIQFKYIQPMKEMNTRLNTISMEQEITLVENTEMILGEFESRYGDLRQASADIMESYFRAAENAENVYFEQTSALIGELLEQFGDDKLPDDVTDECRSLLADREILINSCATSHDTHLSKLLTVEEGLRNRGNQETLSMISNYKLNEWTRNRSAVMEIRKLKESNNAKIQNVLNEWLENYEDMYQDDDQY